MTLFKTSIYILFKYNNLRVQHAKPHDCCKLSKHDRKTRRRLYSESNDSPSQKDLIYEVHINIYYARDKQYEKNDNWAHLR